MRIKNNTVKNSKLILLNNTPTEDSVNSNICNRIIETQKEFNISKSEEILYTLKEECQLKIQSLRCEIEDLKLDLEDYEIDLLTFYNLENQVNLQINCINWVLSFIKD